MAQGKGDQDYSPTIEPKTGEDQTDSIPEKEKETGSSGTKSHRGQVRTRETKIWDRQIDDQACSDKRDSNLIVLSGNESGKVACNHLFAPVFQRAKTRI